MISLAFGSFLWDFVTSIRRGIGKQAYSPTPTWLLYSNSSFWQRRIMCLENGVGPLTFFTWWSLISGWIVIPRSPAVGWGRDAEHSLRRIFADHSRGRLHAKVQIGRGWGVKIRPHRRLDNIQQVRPPQPISAPRFFLGLNSPSQRGRYSLFSLFTVYFFSDFLPDCLA